MSASPFLALILAAPQMEWTALELPNASLVRGTTPAFPALLDGRHLVLEPREDSRPNTEGPMLPPLRAAQILEGEARRAGRTIEVYQGAPPLVVRGDEATVEWARELLGQLDSATSQASIRIDALLAPVAGNLEGGDVSVPALDPLPEGAWRWVANLASGDTVALGERQRRSFISNFDVEVATDSGVASPLLGRVEFGETLHLRACRIDGGNKLFISGLLDLAELQGVAEFDPGGPDLGIVEQPTLSVAQVAFSGVVESGGSLRVELYGLPLSSPSWTLWVKAETRRAAPAPPGGWQLADLALLADPPRTLPPFALGAELGYAALPAVGGGAKAVSPGGLIAMVESSLRRGARGGGSVAWPTERYVLLPAEENEVWLALGGLAGALEEGRSHSARIELRHGDIIARLPIASGAACRVSIGTERVWLVGYTSQIAPDVWMPSPIVDRGFDGLVFQGRFEGGTLAASTVVSRTDETIVHDREAAYLGALQLPLRTSRGDRSEHAPGPDPRTVLEGSGSRAGVTIQFQSP